ncbi:MAG: beta-propeller fold lactonase family protein, partial [Mucilaginibacter sp.]|uniref:beta-propeller fold lactonase family protein n=1 Tax=Mucilaginibacter sp. TaxID=1882438 RepID=UPI002631C6B6
MKPLKQHVLRIKIILFLIVLPAVLKAQSNQTVNAGSQTVVVNFPVTTCTYNWTNNNTAIGLGASGTGDIATFTATNTTGNPITATITATPAGPTPQPPLLYIPNFDANTVSVINATTNTLLTTVPVGTNPYGVMVSHDYNRVYIANQGSNDVSVIYMPTNRVLATIPGFSTPGAIAVSPDNQTIYVANSGSNTVAIIDALNNTIIATIPVGQSPIGLSLNFDGSKLYVANNNSLTVSVINIATKAVTNTIILNSNPDFTLLSPDGSKLYVVESFLNEIMVVNTTTNLVTTFVVPGNKPKGVAISPDGSRLYVANSADGNIAVINTTNNTIITTINTGATPTGLSISDDGSLLYVCNSGSNNVSVINTTTLLVTQTINVRARPFSVGNFYLTRADCGAPITFNITVNAAAPTPVITTNGTPSAVSTIFGTPSTPATFMAGASNATGNLVVSAPTGFEVSLDNSNYYNVVTMNGPGSITSRTAYIRLKSTTPMGTYSGNIVLTSPGATTVNVIMPLSTVTAPNPFITATGTPSSVNTAYGTPSSPTSFMVSGTGMSDRILVTPPPGFEASTDGVNFASTVTIGGIGAIASTKVYIRLKKTTAAGTYSGNIV